MRILLHRGDGNTEPWIRSFAEVLPQAEVVVYADGVDIAPCDYAVLWSPPAGLMPHLAHVKAIFITGAGVDGIMKFNDSLPDVPIVRLNDAGMAVQMAEYVAYAVLRYFRRFDEYEQQGAARLWKHLPQYAKSEFAIGVLGTGVMGQRVLSSLAGFGFPLRGWSRGARQVDGVQTYAGMEQLDEFLRGLRVLVCLLPLTPGTASLLDRARLSLLAQGAFLINAGRGAHVIEQDLLDLVRSGHIAGATLDVTREEPLPAHHPFWDEPRITITPHMAAKIAVIERGGPVADTVDRARGY